MSRGGREPSTIDLHSRAAVGPPFGLRRSPCSNRPERQFDGPDADHVAIFEADWCIDAAIADERPVLAAEILERRLAPGDAEQRVPPRDARRIDKEPEIRITS